MSIEIRKAGIRRGIFLAYEYILEAEGISATNKTQSTAPIHEDLRNTFKKLIPHFILLTEEMAVEKIQKIIENNETLPEDIEKKYSVTDFEFGGNDDSKTVKLTGFKVLSNDKSVGFTTPSQKLYEDRTDGYKFDSYLRDAIDELVSEVEEYMDGKQAPRNEVGSFDFPEGDEEAFTIKNDPVNDLLDGLSENISVEVSANGKTKKLGKGRKKDFDIETDESEIEE